MKCWAGWITSWNQDCWEKYQQPYICRWYHPNGRKRRTTKEPLVEGERGEIPRDVLNVGLKLNIQKTKTMASGPITSWQIDGKTMEAVTDFIFLGSKITADDDCSHEIKRHFLLGRKAVIKLESLLKNRDITSPTKVHIIKVMVFLVVYMDVRVGP